MSLCFTDLGWCFNNGLEPLGQREDYHEIKRGAAELQHRGQDVHKHRAECYEIAGGHSEFFPVELSSVLEIGVKPKQDCCGKKGKDLVEDLDAVRNLARFEG